jgi:hypothetical protein
VTRFEYLSVLISIVIALGLSEVMVCWGRLLQHRAQVRFSWLHAFWSALVVLLMIQYWWGFWNFRTVESWTLASLVSVVMETAMLVVCALLLTPGRSLSGRIDLEALYYEHARPLFVLGSLLLLQQSAVDVLVMEAPVLHPRNLVRCVGAVVLALAAWSPDRRLHRALPVAAALLVAVFLANSLVA